MEHTVWDTHGVECTPSGIDREWGPHGIGDIRSGPHTDCSQVKVTTNRRVMEDVR